MNTDINEKCWYKDICSKCGEGCHMCIKYLEMNYLMTHSNLPKSKQKSIKLSPTTRNDTKMFKRLNDIRLDIYDFVQEGKNLYICSPYTGNGKTSWAIKLLHKYFENVWDGNCMTVRGMFVHVPSLLNDLKDFENKPLDSTFKKNLKECDLVVWDDIGCELMSSYDLMQLMVYIDYRTLAEKSNIFTGNLTTPESLNRVLGPRLVSRVYNNSIVIELDGGDERYGSFTDTE